MPILILVVFVLVILVFSLGIWVGLIVGLSKAMRKTPARSQKTNLAIRGWFLSGMGLLFFLAAIFIAAYSWNFLHHALPAQGLVVGFKERQDKEHNSVSYASVFAFQDGRGVTHTNRVFSSYTSRPGYQLGEIVPVLYNQLNPAQAKINSFMEIWGTSAILGGLGLMLMIVAAGMLLWPRFVNRFKNVSVSPTAAKSQSK
ncbi:DUF3592 domain-containing protein [Pedosphaera parvula]|uniref:DUF3592 domain-containing protein n=1 Tax=Pedosphaera parvula (strain Ellin514) TaxID=320771 RepID=B9XJY9_PEDPL|nr:DUF3592 domain-containing protein [Pedosphaera parvula]EEF59812.1 hypothetical protein Cflav_PD2819 [Pedosphaera parvula Ellin514]